MTSFRQVIASTGNLRVRAEPWIHKGALPQSGEQAAAAAQRLRPNVMNTFVAPERDLEAAVSEVWQKLMGLDRSGTRTISLSSEETPCCRSR